MTRLLHARIFVAASLLGCLTPAAAETVTVKVRYGDLDLASPAGIDSLHHRIRRAAVFVCGSDLAVDIQAKIRIDKCREKAIGDASSQVDVAVASASAGYETAALVMPQPR